ncbi:MAG: hypothetical protein QOJ37_717 [Pseudonocardiales bacterium]|nr:hypothetical protein [Pseudonocardiales bacterium]
MIDARDALGRAASIGEYFAVDVPCGPGSTSLATLLADPSLQQERVAVTRRALATQSGRTEDEIEERAAASIWFLGFVSRLVSPAFGAAVVAGAVPRLTPATVHWRSAPSGPAPIAIDDVHCSAGPPAELAAALHDEVIATVVLPLADAVGEKFHVARQLLLGNIASSIVGAAIVVGIARPDVRDEATDLAQRVVNTGQLAGTGRFTGPRGFVRNSCCLLYRVPAFGYCGDCVLA